MMFRLTALAVLLALAPGDSSAADGQAALDEFHALLAGRYDSLAHRQEDEAAGLTPEQVHGWVTRTFTPIASPSLSAPAVVATVTYNGPEGTFDEGEFQLWMLSEGGDETVIMTPYGFGDPDAFRESALDPAAFSTLAPGDLAPPHGAAGCPIVWRRSDEGWSGYTDPATCTSLSTQMNVELGWEWNFRLTTEAMWIDFAGYGADGEMVYGRADRIPWRLDRQS